MSSSQRKRRSPVLSDAEWVIAGILWDAGPLSAAEVRERLPRERPWTQKTVNTFLARLVGKGVLGAAPGPGVRRYRPRIPRERCTAEEGEAFRRRVFRGLDAPLVTHFLTRATLTQAEVDALAAILRAKRPR